MVHVGAVGRAVCVVVVSAALQGCIGKPEYATAREYYQRGVALSQDPRPERRDLRQALRYLNTAVRMDPKMADAYRARGQVHQAEFRTDQAFRDFSKALQLNPGDHAAYSMRGAIQASRRRFAQAVADLTAAIERARDNPLYVYRRGLVYQEWGKPREAVADLYAAGTLFARGGYVSSVEDCIARIESLEPGSPSSATLRALLPKPKRKRR